jgi:hypothetical protein
MAGGSMLEVGKLYRVDHKKIEPSILIVTPYDKYNPEAKFDQRLMLDGDIFLCVGIREAHDAKVQFHEIIFDGKLYEISFAYSGKMLRELTKEI